MVQRLLKEPVPLYPFARSRTNPVRRTVSKVTKAGLLWHENAGWRLAGSNQDMGKTMRKRLPALLDELAELDDAQFDGLLSETYPRAEAVFHPEGAENLAQILEVIRRDQGFLLRENQITCALALLCGSCVELRTGEGKTLAAGMAAMLAARVGVSCHVITMNDYLAARDAELLVPMAERLGLRVSVITSDTEDAERRAAYDADIVYGTNKAFVFDHLRDLRDQRVKSRFVPRQTGQALAICDEADSVLIDDATVPMILSETGADMPDLDLALFQSLDRFVQTLPVPSHRIQDKRGTWRLTPKGIQSLVMTAQDWLHPVARSTELISLAEKALSARFQFLRGDAYVINEDHIEMIDQSTGRLMPDRRWEYGLQQLIELTAGVEPTADSRTVAQITQQTYFRQYRVLSGLTGTAHECRQEFWSIYRLPVDPVAAHAPSRLKAMGLKICSNADKKWRRVAARALELSQDRAVLIGVNDVSETEALAAHFPKDMPNLAVLDAMSEAEEAELVAEAGRRGQITIATHLAGRGTDIALDPDVLEAGGLHVIIASAMASVRLEKQFFGRAARKGQPGSYEHIIAQTDRILRDGSSSLVSATARVLLRVPLRFVQARALRRLQLHRDGKARAERRRGLLREQQMVQQLGYK